MIAFEWYNKLLHGHRIFEQVQIHTQSESSLSWNEKLHQICDFIDPGLTVVSRLNSSSKNY